MPRRLIKKYLPKRDEVLRTPGMGLFGKMLHEPNLWHLNRHSVSVGVAIGLFVAFLPVPGQVFIAPAIAILMRANLPIAFAMIFITNPLTIAPVFLLAYKLGQLILDTPPINFQFVLSWQWLSSEFSRIWQPLLLGSMIMSISASSIGYTVMNSLWRFAVRKRWKERRKRRKTSKI